MTQALSTVSRSTSGSLPAAASRPLLDLVSRFTNRLEEIPGDVRRYSLPKASAPNDEQRAAMERRRSVLVMSLTPDRDAQGHPPKAVRQIVASLLVAFPAFGEQQAASSALEAMYTRAVQNLPLWAIQDAASRFVEGRARISWPGDRCPTPPQVVTEARLSMREIEDELARLNHVLDAEVYEVTITPAQRAEFDLALKAATDAGTAQRTGRRVVGGIRGEAPEATLERLKLEGMGGRKLSDIAIAAIKAKTGVAA